MLAANIPLHEVSNPYFSDFLEKYTVKTPKSTLRQGYVDQCYVIQWMK